MMSAVKQNTRTSADNRKLDGDSDRPASESGQRKLGTIKLLAGCVVFISSVLIAFYASQVNAAPVATDSYSAAGLYPWLIMAFLALFPLLASAGMKHRAPLIKPLACENAQNASGFRPNGQENDQQTFRHIATGQSEILNTREFSRNLAHYWSTCTSQSSYLALFIVQIDNFSQLADIFGHQETQSRLQQTTHSLNSLICSRGGIISHADERENPRLHVLLPNTTPDEAYLVAEEIRLAIEDLGYPAHADGRGIMTASLGLAVTVPNHGATPDTLWSGADRALHRVHQRGHNRVIVEILGNQSKP